ncbi:MAG: hypothetical protein WCR67_04440 [Bacilli bacterium]
MTYLERITYLTGNFIQLAQYTLKNAYFVKAINETIEASQGLISSSALYVTSHDKTKSLIMEHEFSGSEAQLACLENSGISEKDLKLIRKVLKKRDYLSTYYFIENGSEMAREEVAVYASMIATLQDLCKDATTVIASLNKASEKLLTSFNG